MFGKLLRTNRSSLLWRSVALLALISGICAYVIRDLPTVVHTGMYHVRTLHKEPSRYEGGPRDVSQYDQIWDTFEVLNPTGNSIWVTAKAATISQPAVAEIEYKTTGASIAPGRTWESNRCCGLDGFHQVEVKPHSSLTVAVPARIRGSLPTYTAMRIPYDLRPYGPSSRMVEFLRGLRERVFDESGDGCIYLPLQPELPSIPATPHLVVTSP
jgi:hypothetical protein